MLHDYFFNLGGAERVTATIAKDVAKTDSLYALGTSDAVTNSLGLPNARLISPLRVTRANYRALGLLTPIIAKSLRPIKGNALVSSYAFAHHIPVEGRKVVYCHSPLRQIWSGAGTYAQTSVSMKIAIRGLGPILRHLDRSAARTADAYIANSRLVHDRILQYYGVEPVATIPPPIDDAFFASSIQSREDYFVWAGRIVEPYKRLSLVIETFRELDARLVVAGTGRDEARLRASAPTNVEFVGALDAAALSHLFSKSRAVIFPSLDDFGMIPIEASAAGAPVIAYGAGGALETVVEGATGTFFSEPSVSSLRSAIDVFRRTSWDSAAIRAHAQRYSTAAFVERLSHFVTKQGGSQ